MPFIHIKSLAFEPALNVGEVIKNIAADFSAANGIGIEHITVTWDYFAPHHYAVGGRTASTQPRNSHPLLVDFLTPDFNSEEKVRQMILNLVAAIAKHAGVADGNIFVHHRWARSGRVFDGGEIVEW